MAVAKTLDKNLIDVCTKYENRMDKIQKEITPAEHAIYPSEMLAVCAICEESGTELIIESGRQFGYSTEILAEWFGNTQTQITSIDHLEPTEEALFRLNQNKYDYVKLETGDGNILIPELVKDSSIKRAVLLDGPKYHEALNLAIWLKGLVDWVFIHDMEKWNFSEWTHTQVAVTSSPEFTAKFTHLDSHFLTTLGYKPDSPGGGLAVLCLLEDGVPWK